MPFQGGTNRQRRAFGIPVSAALTTFLPITCKAIGLSASWESMIRMMHRRQPLLRNPSASRMLEKSARGVLASLRGSTYRVEPLGYRNHWRGFSVRQDSFKGRTAHTKCGLYLLASSLAAALPAERRVSARWGWAGETSAFLNILRGILLSSHTCKQSKCCHVEIIFPQPARR